MQKIICRADGNANVGLGHLYRMFALYEIYKDTYNVTFVTRTHSEIDSIPEYYQTKYIPNSIAIEDEPEWINEHFDSKSYIIILDGYQFVGNQYQKELRDFGYYIIYIDDFVSKKIHANIIVNHSPKLQREDFNIRNDSIVVTGTKYAILRPLFLEAAKINRKINDIDTVFVCFGGADQYDLSLLSVKALLDFNKIRNIHIVVGSAYKHNAIFEKVKKHSKIKIYQNLGEQDLIKIMRQCNFAIVPSSTILYELCCVKMPVLSGFFVENQKNIYNGFVQDQLVYPGDDFSKYTVKDFKIKLHDILKLSNHNTLIENQSKLFDEKIKTRFLNLLLQIKFRIATLKDSKLIYEWANEELVRQNSFNSEPLLFETHEVWFAKKIEDQNQLFLITQIDNEDVGLVRFSINQEHALVGISISKPYRGKGLSSKLLIESSKIYFKTNALPIFAYIKNDNVTSIQAFKNAGYKFSKTTKVKGIDSVIYQLKKNDYN